MEGTDRMTDDEFLQAFHIAPVRFPEPKHRRRLSPVELAEVQRRTNEAIDREAERVFGPDYEDDSRDEAIAAIVRAESGAARWRVTCYVLALTLTVVAIAAVANAVNK
jgi:hypothetical protein